MEKNKTKPGIYPCLKDFSVMPIKGGFASLTKDTRAEEGLAPDFITDEHFKELAASGLNVLNCYIDYDKEPNLVAKSMDLAHKYGLGYIVWDSWLMERFLSDNKPTKEEVEKRVENYRHHPAYCGMQILDEPTSESYMPNPRKNISNFVDLIQILKEADVQSIQCILPLYDYHIEENREIYKAYVREYCDSFQPRIFTYDHYPFVNKGPQLERFFWNMSVIREISAEYKIPYGVTIQAGGQWNDHCAHFDSIAYYPTEGQFYWNINVCLAMGCKAIGYFPVVQPFHFSWAKTEKYDFKRNGFFGHDGSKNSWYYYAQNISKQIVSIDEVLMNSRNQGIIVKGAQAEKDVQTVTCLVKEQRYKELVEVDGDVLIGCFDYEGKTAFYVVNYDMESAQKIRLQFEELCDVFIIQNSKSHYDTAKTLELEMVAGEGVLVVVE